MPAGWSAIGAGLFCPVLVSPAPGRIVLLARTAGGELVRRDRLPDGGGWGTARSLGVPTARSRGGGMDVPVDWQLAACGGGSDTEDADGVELVARSPDGDLLHARLGTDGRVRFECLGAPAAAPAGRAIPLGIVSPPAACHGAPDRLDVFAVGQAGDLLHAVRSGGEWTPFDALGAPAGAPPAEAVAASSCGPSRIAMFRRGSAGDLLLKWWDGAAWSGYVSLGSPQIPDPSYPAVTAPAPLTGPPAACSWNPTRLDVFARGPAGDLAHAWWNGADWSSFESLGLPAACGRAVPLSGAVTVAVRARGRATRWRAPSTGICITQPGVTMHKRNLSMFFRAAAAVAALVCLALAAPHLRAQQDTEYRPVTDAELRDPPPGDWLMYRRTYNGWGYSPLDQITMANVADLQPAWAFATGLTDGHESPPIVNDGAMFITTPQNNVLALDARTGDMKWRYVRMLPEELRQIHPTNRGVALYGDKVYMATVDSFVVALDAETGSVVWESAAGDWQTGYYMTMAPLAVNGKVLVGVSGGELGIRGFVAAFDAETGSEVWRTHTVPGPGEPGNETWPGDTWQTGATPVWVTGTYDPELNLTYWGTGNAGPWMGDKRPGDNLYANSVIALDADTGELKGYHQYHWNGSWDWDEVAPPLLIDVDRGGRTVKGLVHPGRNGYLWLLERAADRIGFIDAAAYVYQNVFTSIDPETGRPQYDPERKPRTGTRLNFCPSIWGGKNWPPAAFNPVTGYLYFSANDNLCAFMNTREVEYTPGQAFTGGSSQMYVRDGADHIGELQAWNLDSGEEVWTREFESHNWGPVLTTAGGLVFAGGTNDRYFRAFDGRTGETLWEQRTNSGVIGVPTSYTVDGVQYVAVQAGWGLDAARMQNALDRSRGTTTLLPQGGVLWVFALPQ